MAVAGMAARRTPGFLANCIVAETGRIADPDALRSSITMRIARIEFVGGCMRTV